MIAYACVYRNAEPSPRELARTAAVAKTNPLLDRFLAGYEGSLFDWGDDPGFFAAQDLLGDVRRASWGVCRPDVRRALDVGSFVVFFVEVPSAQGSEYRWVGLGSVERLVATRTDIWKKEELADYRGFLNLLVSESGSHREFFDPPHENWQHRAGSPYVIFDPELSRFDLTNPLVVSTYERAVGLPDVWHTSYPHVRDLESLIFDTRTDRRLRTSASGFGHAKLRIRGTAEELRSVRRDLLQLFDSSTGSGAARRDARKATARSRGVCR